MNKRADIIRVSEWLWAEFAIMTTDPHKLGAFARDALARNPVFTVGELLLRESLERVSKW